MTPTNSFLRARRGGVPSAPPAVDPARAGPAGTERTPPDFVYVDETRIADLRRIENDEFDLRKLIALCEELNHCYRAQCYHAVAALTRAVIDHLPPVFRRGTFAEVVSSHGTRSFKECMRRLEDAARKIADAHLHTPIRSREALPTRVQVNFSNELDVLLAEVIRVLEVRPSSSK